MIRHANWHATMDNDIHLILRSGYLRKSKLRDMNSSSRSEEVQKTANQIESVSALQAAGPVVGYGSEMSLESPALLRVDLFDIEVTKKCCRDLRDF